MIFWNGYFMQELYPKKTKYGSRKTFVDGIPFDSKKEAKMYAELKLMQKGGLISKLRLQPVFILQRPYTNAAGKKIRAIKYIADFKFYDEEQERIRVIDCKGFRTEKYRLKKKIFDYINKKKNLYLEEHYGKKNY